MNRPSPHAAVLDRAPISAPEAEVSLLGAMLAAGGDDVHMIGEVMGIIRGPSDFTWPKHQMLYGMMTRLYSSNQSMDASQLASALRSDNALDDVGGIEYIEELMGNMLIATNAPHYAKQVVRAARARQIVNMSAELLEQAYRGDDPDEIIGHAMDGLFKASDSSSKGGLKHIGEIAHQTVGNIKLREPGRITGIRTGFSELDEAIDGLQKSMMYVLGARPSQGKSALMSNMAFNIARSGVPVAVFSLEMSDEALAIREIAAQIGLDSKRVARNDMGDDNRRALEALPSELENCPVYLDDTPALTPAQLLSRSQMAVSRYGVGVIMLDYLTLMRIDNRTSDTERATEASMVCKALAKRLNVPMVVLSQLNRANETRADKRPLRSDLRQSGQVEQDADVIMFLHREHYYDHNAPREGAELIIAKNKNGPCMTIDLTWHQEVCLFEDAADVQARNASLAQYELEIHNDDPEVPF